MKSNFKRAVASISTIALAASTFAGFSLTASAATEVDYIGSSSAAETFDNYDVVAAGWTNASAKTSDGSSLTVKLGGDIDSASRTTVADAPTDAKVVSGKVLTTRVRGNGAYNASTYAITPVATGKVVLNADIGTYSSGPYDSHSIVLADDSDEAVLTISVPYNGNIKVNSTNSKFTVDPRNTNPYGYSVAATIDLDANKADVTLVYDAANGTTGYTDTISVDIEDKNIAALKATVYSYRSSTNQDVNLDNIKFYSITDDSSTPSNPTPTAAATTAPTAAATTAPTAAATTAPVVPTGVNKVVPYAYPVTDIDYGVGGVQAGDSAWTANSDKDTVTFNRSGAGVHYVGIDNENNLGYPVNKIIIPRTSGLTSGTLWILKDAPSQDSMNNAASGAFTRKTGLNDVKSFIGVENQLFGHVDALEDIDNPTTLNLDNVIARVVLNGGNSYTVTAGSNGIAKTETKSTGDIEITINTTVDSAGVPVSLYQDDDLLIYGVSATGTFGPIKVDFRIPAEQIEIPQPVGKVTADYFSDHTQGIYYIGRANTNGLSTIKVTGSGQNADTIVKIFALTNKLSGKDEKKDFLHDYVHQETKKNSGTYKNAKYNELAQVEIPAGSTATVSANVNDPEVGTKFIYAVVMKKTPVENGTSEITETGTVTAPIAEVIYGYTAKRYAEAVEAEYLLLNLEVEDVIDIDGDYALRSDNGFDYNQYQSDLQSIVDRLQTLHNSRKSENVFTETYAAKWGKIRDEKEAMEVIVKPIYDEITTLRQQYPDISLIRVRDINAETTDLFKKAVKLRNMINEIWQSYTKASIAGKSYVKDNNFDELEAAYKELQSFYDDVIAEYTNKLANIYGVDNSSVKITQANYLSDEGRALKQLNDLITSGQYDYDKERIAKKVAEAIDPEEGGIDIKTIVNDLNNIVKTFIPVTRDDFDEKYEKFLKDYEAATTPAEKKDVIDNKATELSSLVDAITTSAYESEIKDAIGTDYRYSWANKVDNFIKFRNRSRIIEAANTFITATADAKKVIDKDENSGISVNSYDNIIEKYWVAAEARTAYEALKAVVGETPTILAEYGIDDDVADAEKNLDESWLYVQRSAEIITADVRAALDDLADDAIYTVEPVDGTVNNIIKEFTKFKYTDSLYTTAMSHPYIDTFLGGYTNKYFPFAQAYTFPSNTIERSKAATDAIDYVTIYNTVKNQMQAYYDEANAQIEALYDANIDTLKDDIATLSFRDIVFDNFQSKYDAMKAVNDKMAILNKVVQYNYQDSSLNGNPGSSDISAVYISIKNNEENITTETRGSVRRGLRAGGASNTAYVNFNSLLINQYKMLKDKIEDLSKKDKALLTAIQNLINVVAPGQTLADFAIGQANTRSLVEQVEDYIINTLPDPSKDVEGLLAKVDTALDNHKKAKLAYDNAYTSVYNDIDTKAALHTTTDYTAGNNNQDDPGANDAPDYYYDLDPIKYTGVYFTKRDADAWQLRLRPAVETGLDARAGYDAASIADLMLLIPDGTITEDNYHEWDATVIPAHEAYERARQATKDKVQSDYANAYNHYITKWNEFVAVNDAVANNVAAYTAAAEAEANNIIATILGLYEKVTDPETVYNTVEDVETDIDTIINLEKQLDDDINDVNDVFTYLNRNYFKHVFVIEDYEARIWTIESILDDWHKCIPVIERANADLNALDIVDDLDDTNVKVGYKVVIGDKDAYEEIFDLEGEYNTIRNHGGTMISRTAHDLLDDAMAETEFKYYAYSYATELFGTPAYKIPNNLNFYNVDLYKNDIETLYDFYRAFGQDVAGVGGIEPIPGRNIYSEIHRTVDEFFMDEVEKINRLYDVLDNVRPAGTYFAAMPDYDAAGEFNADLQDYVNGASTLDATAFYEKYLELLSNHPKAVPFLDPTLYAAYLAIVGERDELALIAFTNNVKNFNYGSYAHPWDADEVGVVNPDEETFEADYQTAYQALIDEYDALSSNAKDIIDDPDNTKVQQDAAKAYKLLTESIPAWHKDFVEGYKAAAIASSYAAVANNYRGNINEATYKDALAAYNNAIDAIATLDKYEAHNMYQAEVTNIYNVTNRVNPNFDDLTRYLQYADQYESDITEGLTSTLKSAVGEQLAKTAAVIATEELINKIGTVTVDSGEVITTSRQAYEELPNNYKSEVKNYSVLVAAENAYASLPDVVNAKSYAGPAIEAIDAIGTVTRQSGDTIKDARAKYDALSNLSKSFVRNIDVLEKAEEDYAKLEKASGDVTGDGSITASDVNIVLQAILGTVALTDAQTVAADVNQDGKINVLDLVEMILLW